MAFAEDPAPSRYPERVTVWPQDERGLLDLGSLLKEPRDDTLVYCCGPEALLGAVEQQCAHWPTEDTSYRAVRCQRRLRQTTQLKPSEQFEVVCHRSGVSFEITSDQSILEVLEEVGIPILGSCYEGVCGTCEAKVLEGTPVHRDSVLSDAEKAAGEVMMPCVSRSRTERLVLDL